MCSYLSIAWRKKQEKEAKEKAAGNAAIKADPGDGAKTDASGDTDFEGSHC